LPPVTIATLPVKSKRFTAILSPRLSRLRRIVNRRVPHHNGGRDRGDS
jgi:hypothetical protein